MIQIGGVFPPGDLGFTYDESDPRPYEEQYKAWRLTRDTKECDITNYPGHGDQHGTRPHPPVTVTKRGRRR